MSSKAESTKKAYVIDTNVLIHDPNSILNFDEHLVVIPITVLEELDKLKNGNKSIAADCRSAIRLIDSVIADSPTERLQKGVPIPRNNGTSHLGKLAIMMNKTGEPPEACLPNDNNDNKIINRVVQMQLENPEYNFVLVTKDINMRLKARGCRIHAEDYHNDQLISDVKQLSTGYHEFEGSFWDRVAHVDTIQRDNGTFHSLARDVFEGALYVNQYVLDDQEFLARIEEVNDEHVLIKHIKRDSLMHQSAWGLQPRNIYQAMALHALLDNDVHLVNLTGPAGSGKTILALAAAIEMTVAHKMYNKIIVTRSTPPLAEDHGFLPGTEEEKMDPWLGAITDNIEALHIQDESPQGSIEYVKERANIQFKALNYIRGRSFQRSLILIDESQNLTPHQMKAIITRAGEGSKVICLGNLAQIDTPYLSPISSGLTYMTERFKGFRHSTSLRLNGIPRSLLAEYAEANL
ncbi:PhoH family protein [Ketobacter sp.]|uniref:PhoH family protein n=1 Tax=Ketobacter sp. TaxID=2083498 RepID=UPI0025C0A3AC|nr:PhoH family protein [Ketobacter sp.]MEE2731711.1 PhoH family protein [Pseudomonadota bacterium]